MPEKSQLRAFKNFVLFSCLVLVKHSFNSVCVISFDEESEMLKYFKSPFMKQQEALSEVA